MFPQYYFLTSISQKFLSNQQKLTQIKKQLSSLNNYIGVVVVAGSLESIRLGDELFGQQNLKRKLFIEESMRDRIYEEQSKFIKFGVQQQLRYEKLYLNFEQFKQQRLQTNMLLQNNLIAFTTRIKKLKQQLLHYRHHVSEQNQQKILLIADRQVLNHLAATDYHQNGQPVNGLHLNEGQMDFVSLVIDQEESMKQLRKGDNIFCG